MQSVARTLLESGAIRVDPAKPFTFASGLRSPIYTDNRQLLSLLPERELVSSHLLRESGHSYPQANVVAGVATAGIPWAAWLASALELPLLYVRSAAKERGLRRQIEGRLPDQARVVVVEDLVTTGQSSVAVVEALREAGADVLGVLCIFNYETPLARDRFAALDVTFRALCGLSDVLTVGSDLVGPTERAAIDEWRAGELATAAVPATA